MTVKIYPNFLDHYSTYTMLLFFQMSQVEVETPYSVISGRHQKIIINALQLLTQIRTQIKTRNGRGKVKK